jgi:DNA-binding NarL/FixJ family response regulator
MAIRILLADDHEIVREGIRTLVARSGRGWEICGEARNGREAVEMARTLKPDIAVLDITMPEMSGLEAAKEISTSSSVCRSLIFTMHESSRLGIEARQAGAQGFVVKSQAARDLIRAIDDILGGKTFFGGPTEPEKKEPGKSRGTLNALLFRVTAFV